MSCDIRAARDAERSVAPQLSYQPPPHHQIQYSLNHYRIEEDFFHFLGTYKIIRFVFEINKSFLKTHHLSKRFIPETLSEV